VLCIFQDVIECMLHMAQVVVWWMQETEDAELEIAVCIIGNNPNPTHQPAFAA
jgi:hypothetical protein